MTRWNHLTASGALLLVVFGFFFGLSSSAFGATNRPFSMSLGFDFASGDYGTSQTNDSYSIPMTIGYYPGERLDFTLEIPYLYQSGDSTVSLGGMRFSMQNLSGTTGGNSGGGMTGMGGTSAQDAAVSGSTTTSVRTSQSGIGDISLTVGYVLFAESATAPMIRPLAYAKLPTADKDKGLGTGAFDFGGGLSAGKGFGIWSVYAEALYVAPGSTLVYKPNNYLNYRGLVRYQLNRKVDAGLAVSGATAAFAGNSDVLEVQLESNWRVSPQGRVGTYVGKGLSESSPDYSVGFYGSVSF